MIILYSWQEEGQIQITYDGAASDKKLAKGLYPYSFLELPLF